MHIYISYYKFSTYFTFAGHFFDITEHFLIRYPRGIYEMSSTIDIFNALLNISFEFSRNCVRKSYFL